MDIISTVINQVVAQASGGKSELPNSFLNQISNFFDGVKLADSNVKPLGGNSYQLYISKLDQLVQNLNSLQIKTNAEIPKTTLDGFKVNATNVLITEQNGKPVLNIKGFLQPTANPNNATQQPNIRFETNIPLLRSDLSNNVNYANGSSTNLIHDNSANTKSISDNVILNQARVITADAKITNIDQNFARNINNNFPSNASQSTPSVKIDIIPQAQTTNPQTSPLAQLSANPNIAPQSLSISGTYVFDDVAKQGIVKTELGNFVVNDKINLNSGTKVNVQIISISQENSATKPEVQLRPELSQIKQILTSPDGAMPDLSKTALNNQALQSAVSLFFPNYNNDSKQQNYAKALWFLGGVSSMDTTEDFDLDIKNNLKSSGLTDENISKLKEVFDLLKSYNGKTERVNGQNWNNYLMPFYNDETLNLASFYIQPESQSANASADSKTQKFMVDFEQSAYGQVVIEGNILKIKEKVSQINIEVYAERGFSDEEKTDLKIITISIAETYNSNLILNFKEDNALAHTTTSINSNSIMV